MSTLRISPKYKSCDWQALKETNSAHWTQAVEIVKDRLYGRYLNFADKYLEDDFSGFVVLSIDCLLVETIQQFIEGETDGTGQSKRCFDRFLARPRFCPDFNSKETRKTFYKDIRCGLLHQAQAKNKWLVRRKQRTMLQKRDTDVFIIDIERFHAALKASFEDYLAEILKSESADLRAKLWTKMNHICNVRVAKGAMELLDATAGDSAT